MTWFVLNTLHTPDFLRAKLLSAANLLAVYALLLHVHVWSDGMSMLSLSGESNIRTHLVTLNLVWALQQVTALFLPALWGTLSMFSLSWNVDWVSHECQKTLAHPAASILPAKHSRFRSAAGAENYNSLTYTWCHFCALYCGMLPEELSIVPPKNRILPPRIPPRHSKRRPMQPAVEPNKWLTPALSSLSHNLVFCYGRCFQLSCPCFQNQIRANECIILEGIIERLWVCMMRLILLFQPHQSPLCRNIYTAICLQ